MSLLDDLLRLFGTNRVRIRWRLQRLRESLHRRGAASDAPRPAMFQHQLCPSCGHPADASEKTCTRCGARLAGVTAARAGKLLEALLPEGVPVVSMVFLSACIALYLVTLKASYDHAGVDGFSGSSPDGRQLIRYGANLSYFIFERGEYWRLVTSNFLHGGVLHIGFNAYALFTAGSLIEERWGRARTIFLLTVTGVAGSFASAYLSRHVPHMSVGASTAAFGLMGFVVAHALRFRHATASLRARFIPWLLFGLVMSFADKRVDWEAHLGGLAAGGLLGAAMVDLRHARKLVPEWVWKVLAAASVAVVVWAFYQCAQWAWPEELQ
jgi:rhomboid protease GluP